MAEPVPAGSDVSAGTYQCTDCDNQLQVELNAEPPRPARTAATASGPPSAAATAPRTPTRRLGPGHAACIHDAQLRPVLLRRCRIAACHFPEATP